MELFFTKVYIWIITLTFIFHEVPLVEYPPCTEKKNGFAIK